MFTCTALTLLTVSLGAIVPFVSAQATCAYNGGNGNAGGTCVPLNENDYSESCRAQNGFTMVVVNSDGTSAPCPGCGSGSDVIPCLPYYFPS